MSEASDAAELLAIMTGAVPVEGQIKEGGPARVREIVSRGDEPDGVPVPMVAKDFQDAGLVTIWDAAGNPSKTNRNMLPTQLRKLGPDGKRMFFLEKPNVEPRVGTLKCWLHPERPERAEYDRMGLAVCDRDNLLNEFHLRQHVRVRHKVAWETIELLHQQREKEIDRELQRAILRQAGQAIQGEDAPVRRGRPAKEPAPAA